MKKQYKTPEIEVTVLSCEDIMRTSGDVDIENPEIWED